MHEQDCIPQEGKSFLRRVMRCCVQDMRLAWEEPFGPVVPVVRVKSVEEAVDHCNANNLALQGCVFSRDIDQGELSGPWLRPSFSAGDDADCSVHVPCRSDATPGHPMHLPVLSGTQPASYIMIE